MSGSLFFAVFRAQMPFVIDSGITTEIIKIIEMLNHTDIINFAFITKIVFPAKNGQQK